MNIAPGCEDILRLCLQLANEVISFQKHRVYLRCRSRPSDEGIWKFVDGFVPAEKWPGNFGFYRGMYAALARTSVPADHEAPSDRGPVCLAGIRLSAEIEGANFLRREQGENDFSEVEKEHLRLIAQLAGAAFPPAGGGPVAVRSVTAWMRRLLMGWSPRTTGTTPSPPGAGLMRRLLMVFLDLRDFVKRLPPAAPESPPYALAGKVLEEYMRQACYLCLPEQFGATGKADPGPTRRRVRTTGKLVTEDRKALWITAFDSRLSYRASSRDTDWPPQRRQRLFALSDTDSISATVFGRPHTHWTNTFDQDKWPERKLFADSKSFIVAPLVAGAQACQGVLSLECTADIHLDDHLAAAFTLLAAHAAWPLAEALRREELTRTETGDWIVNRRREEMLKLAQEAEIWQVAQQGFRELGFHRGFFAEVGYEGRAARAVRGLKGEAWGEGMAQVAGLRPRTFTDYAGDCQVLAVRDKVPVIIQNPNEDGRVDPEARAAGIGQPFGIFPLTDAHGRVRRTVHLERKDAIPIRGYEQDLVERLGRAAMEAWENARHRRLEQQWVEQLLWASAPRTVLDPSPEQHVLNQFLKFLEDHDVVTRGRVFKVDGVQQCCGSFGEYPSATRMDGFPLQKLSRVSKECYDRLRERPAEPLLIVQDRDEPGASRRGEFDVYADREATYADDLGKDSLTEWIEAGVYRDNVLEYKVVLDHRGRKPDPFTLGELRLISRMVRNLSWAITRIDYELTRTQLCIDGAIQALNRHQLLFEIDNIARKMGEASRERLHQVNQTLNAVGARKSLCLSDAFGVVRDIIAPHQGSVESVDFLGLSARDDPELSGDEGLELCLILLILLNNAIVATDRSHYKEKKIRVAYDAQRREIEVEDWGDGLPPEQRQRFQTPPRFVAGSEGGHGSGLVLVRILAQELQWHLIPDPAPRQHGTLFRLRM